MHIFGVVVGIGGAFPTRQPKVNRCEQGSIPCRLSKAV